MDCVCMTFRGWMGKTKYLRAFEQGMVVGTRRTGLWQEPQCYWVFHAQQFPMCMVQHLCGTLLTKPRWIEGKRGCNSILRMFCTLCKWLSKMLKDNSVTFHIWVVVLKYLVMFLAQLYDFMSSDKVMSKIGNCISVTFSKQDPWDDEYNQLWTVIFSDLLP